MSNVGHAPQGVLSQALTGNIFVEKNLAFMNEGDTGSFNVFKHDVKNVLVAHSVNPVAAVANAHASTNANIQLSHLQSFQTFNPHTYVNYWREFQPTGDFNFRALPEAVRYSLEDLFMSNVALAAQNTLTNGNGDTANCNGIVPQLLAVGLTDLAGVAPDHIQVAASSHICFRAAAGFADDRLGVALTTTNIFEKLEIMIKNQNSIMRRRPNRKFMVGSTTLDILKSAQRLSLTYKGTDITEDGVARHGGYDIIENTSMPDNTMILCSMGGDLNNDAIQMGTSKSSDMNKVTVDRLSPFSEEYGMLVSFSLEIAVVRPEEVCFYSDQAPA